MLALPPRWAGCSFFRHGELQPLTVVLAGLVVSLYLGSLTGIIMLLQDSWHDSLQLLWRIAAAALVCAVLIKPLAIMSLSDTQAQSLGIPVKKSA